MPRLGRAGPSLTPTLAVAERNLVPTLDRSFDVCPDRPAEPVWMQDIPVRQAYQRVLVQDIYRAQNLERIVETASCDCATRFPSWDAAEAVFRERYASDERLGNAGSLGRLQPPRQRRPTPPRPSAKPQVIGKAAPR